MLSGYLFAIGATAIWSGNFIIARGLNESIPPISLAFWRWVVAVAVFLPFALKPLVVEWHILKKHLPFLSLTALLGISVFNTLIYFAGHTTTAINLSLISITFPIFIVIFSRIFFQELITVNKGIGIILVAAGVVLLITKGVLASLLNIAFAIGDVWMLLAAIIFAVYSLLLKRRPEALSVRAFQLGTFILGHFFLFPFFLWEYATTPPVAFDATTVYAILYVGIFASLSAFVLWNKAIVAVGPSKAGMIYYTLPLFSGLLAYLFLNEEIKVVHFFSAVLIVSGIFTANFESGK
jgi:drug/metabolite transporter (DMT)-like permease